MATQLSVLTKAPMQRVVEALLREHGLFEAFNESAELHLELENPPYLPLVIERQGDLVAVMHYFILNGDLMRDPELTFQLPEWTPTSITQHPVGLYREVYGLMNDRLVLNARLLHELEGFARLWANNLQAQGFTNPNRVTATSLTHPDRLAAQQTP
jgi:hypothetical protein